MTREEFGQSLNLEVDLIPAGRRNRPGTRNRQEFITIHNTDNTDPGADARAHARFLKNTGSYIHNGERIFVSWHYTVDDERIVKHLPIEEMGFHARNNGNLRSIGIEVCMNQGINQQTAFDRAARLVAALLFDMGKNVSIVVPHHFWTGKNCPRLLLQGGQPGQRWNAFKELINQHLSSIDRADDALDAVSRAAPATETDEGEGIEGEDSAIEIFPVHN